jgi:hypothetical protein
MQSSKEEATKIIKVEKAKQGYSWDDIAEQLNLKFGQSFTGRTLSNKINLGNFRMSLALEILSVLDAKTLDIPDLKTHDS